MKKTLVYGVGLTMKDSNCTFDWVLNCFRITGFEE